MNKIKRFAIGIAALILAGCSPVITTTEKPTEPGDIAMPSSTIWPEQETIPATTVPAKNAQPVYIQAFCTLVGRDPETIAPADTPVVITWGWEAKTDEQIQEFLDNNLTTIQLDGKTINGKINPDIKVNQKSGNPEIVWNYEAGVLTSGRHIIIYDVKFKKMIDDGTTTYGPGGKIESSHDECVVNVQPPADTTSPPETTIISPPATVSPDDDFSGKALDLSKWQPSGYGGASVAQDGQAILTVDGNQPSSSIRVNSAWTLPGDFDVQIDFEIRSGWKSPEAEHLDGAAFGVRIGETEYHITRLRSADADVLLAWSSDGRLSKKTDQNMKATFGSLKMIRSAALLTFYYDIGSGWTELARTEVPETDARIYFMSGSVNASTGFTTYFDNFKVNSGAVTFYSFSDQTILSAEDLPGKEVRPLTNMAPTHPWLPLDENARPDVYFFYFNLKKPPFNNVLVRKAFTAAVDREALVRITTEFGIRDPKPATSFTPPETLGRELYNAVGIPFNPARAKDLLAEAGYPEGEGFPHLSLLISVGANDPAGFNEKLAETATEMWRKNLGIDVAVEKVDFETYKNRILSDPPELFRAMLYPLQNDPHNFLMSFQTNHKNNFGGFSNAEYDRMIDWAFKGNEALTRQEAYVEIERLLVEQEAVVLPIFHTLYP